jgi:hypothetical protein
VYDAGSTVSSAVATVNVTSSSSTNTVPTLPAPWRSVNIGSPGATGSASITNGIYTVAGAGNIGGAADSFRFLYQPLTADGEIRAQIRSAQSTGAAPLAGVMMRETLTPGSKYALLAVRPNGTLYQQYRATTGASSVSAAAGTAVPPNAWVRLVRTGSMFYAYYSTDNVTWRLVNSGTIPMASTIYFGFAVSSGSTAVLNTSTFRSSLIVP